MSPASAQTSLFDQPLSPATPPSALPPPEPGAPPAKAAPTAKPAARAPAKAVAAKPATAPTPVAEAPTTSAEPAAAVVAKAKPKPKPKVAAPARSIGVTNESTNVLTELEVTGDGEVVKLAAPLAPGEKAQLKLPVLKSCTVSVAATFASAGSADTSEYNICKDKTLRFTD